MRASRPVIAILAVAALAATGLTLAASGPAGAGGALVSFPCQEEPETWTVPSGVSEILVEAWGAQGGQGRDGIWTPDGPNFQLLQGTGGKGGYTKTSLAVNPGDELTITVGCQGGDGSMTLNPPNELTTAGGAGGFNGGGAGGSILSAFNNDEDYAVASAAGGGGGGTRVVFGATEIWAGGGGGGAGGSIEFIPGSNAFGGAFGGAGGYGGGVQGGTGLPGAAGSATPTGGGGGTAVGPGTGGTPGGIAGVGSQGANGVGSLCTFAVGASGGAGGGWQGGGSGGVVGGACETYVASGGPAGGGGGSGILEFGVMEGDVREGNGLVVITWDVADGAQPDVQVRKGTSLPYVGRDVYSPTVQKVTTNVPGNSQTFQFKVENDGDEAARFRVSGTAGVPDVKATYLVGGVKVTNAIAAGTYTTPLLAPGGSVTITLNFHVQASAPDGFIHRTTVRATPTTGGPSDQAVAVIKVT